MRSGRWWSSPATRRGGPLHADALARAQGLQGRYFQAVLLDLRRTGFLGMSRGPRGGYRLTRPAAAITVAEVLQTLDGPLLEVGRDDGDAVMPLWRLLERTMTDVLDAVTLADLAAGDLPTTR